eukprot:CAMPEP_0170373224 /NCGR_PEP_ID=MMETSP0117_2-20130122/9960_1 /TAXON_ID=400756 /ORGANISM="Durinskia baltica, Strain CSIRO CS-38" /LENGTH=59 /DNA_ID=CAMNT_0010628111 /DNA_START=415 /DNA_END=595 /DNA_ORIENTATION=+
MGIVQGGADGGVHSSGGFISTRNDEAVVEAMQDAVDEDIELLTSIPYEEVEGGVELTQH